jgi:hypothetical protein
MEDLSKIDVSGVKVALTTDGKGIDVTFDKSKVTERSFKEVLEYIYTDRVAWDKNTDPFLISEVKNAAQYLHLDRLAAICDTYLDKTKNVTVPESTWWKNMKWAFENLRTGKTSLSDLTIVVKEGGDKTVDVPCHACVLCAASDYFFKILLGEAVTEERKTMRVAVDDASEQNILTILKYIYCKEFDVTEKDVASVWVLSNKFNLEDLQVECESLIMKHLTKDNAKDFKQVAEVLGSKRISEMCDEKCK